MHHALPRRAALALPFLAPPPGRASAQAWPSRPVRIVVPYTPGGTTDIATRMVAEPLSRALGQPVVVENRPGSNSIVGVGSVATSPADGHSLVMVIGAHAANATLYTGRLPFDPVASFAPVSHVVTAPLVLAGGARQPYRDFRDFVAFARQRPGAVNYGSSGIGAAAHLTMEDIGRRLGLDLVHVPYRGTQPALQDLMGGQLGVMFDTWSTLKPQFDAGTVRPLGIASLERPGFAPAVPTLAEQGLPGFASSTWCMILAPAGTPAAIVDRLSGEIARAVREPALAARFDQLGFVVEGSTPDRAAEFLRGEVARWGEVIRAANVRAE
ncbi:MAG: tripartite tricarboxylate transporter substrate binding protein [Acetobacteraceae bacterium]|nr:tripartite tricarboxylate transporter substrate binding protein [Acetobacteraceae bacterium]